MTKFEARMLWLLRKMPCYTFDIPEPRRCFRDLEREGLAVYVEDRTGGIAEWQLTAAGTKFLEAHREPLTIQNCKRCDGTGRRFDGSETGVLCGACMGQGKVGVE